MDRPVTLFLIWLSSISNCHAESSRRGAFGSTHEGSGYGDRPTRQPRAGRSCMGSGPPPVWSMGSSSMRMDLVGRRGQIPVSTSRVATLSAPSAVSMVLLVMVAASPTRRAPMATGAGDRGPRSMRGVAELTGLEGPLFVYRSNPNIRPFLALLEYTG